MICAAILLLTAGPLCDVVADVAADVASVVFLSPDPVAKEDECEAGHCRVRGADDADTQATCKDGCDSTPTRRIGPLRRLFRR